jgi:hypothetical protein
MNRNSQGVDKLASAFRTSGGTMMIAIVLAGTLWNPASALADEASKTAKIEEMMQLTHADRMTAQMLDQMKSMVMGQLSKIDMPVEARQASDEMQQRLMDIITDRMSWTKNKPTYIRIYSETFSEADIDGILAFYKSPAGQAMIEKMPQLIQKSMAVAQQLMPEIQRMMAEIKQKYQK